ncbi:hypothetical protein Misp01_81940 [Microtetraspora sp. NBRC 13810]|nr:hypothetical protein Misp01_81940 [Microtetraspora sp. NBRC 13810]
MDTTEVAAPRAAAGTLAVARPSTVGKSTAVPTAARASPSRAGGRDAVRASRDVPAAEITAPAVRTIQARRVFTALIAKRVSETASAKTAGPAPVSAGPACTVSAR